MSTQADTKMEIAIGNLLRIGVSVAAAVVLTGWVLYLVQAHGTAPDYRHFHGKPLQVLQIGPILKGAGRLDSRSVIELGILLLIATPVARVIFCVGGFAAQRDKLYVLVSSVVLAILVYSLFFRS
jgi:uncharacterized membrane protein